MRGRKKRGRVTRSLSRVGKEATGTIMSALGLIPGVGTALGIFDTTRKAMKTAQATTKAGRALKAKVTPRRRRARHR